MASFQISGRGRSSGRRRRRTVRAVDRESALAVMEAEGAIVDECVELPYPLASPEILDHLKGLGVSVSEGASMPECVFEVMRWCIVRHRLVHIQHLEDVEGQPWRAEVEPHGVHRSREGYRLRCFLPPRQGEPDVVADFQVAGWHLYLIEDISWIEAAANTFEPRPCRRLDDEVTSSITFRVNLSV